MEEFKERPGVSGIDEIKNLFGHIITEDELKNQVGNAKKKLIDEVQKKPLAAVAVAAAVGFVLGSILKR
ncbi:MAG: hypothetical protein LAT84_06490 [Balneolia bacterium]|nr:hypothetical protein [Balneolia bacterium]